MREALGFGGRDKICCYWRPGTSTPAPSPTSTQARPTWLERRCLSFVRGRACPPSALLARLLALVLPVTAISCGPAARPAEVEVVELPSFTPAQAALFDDQFHQAALGYAPWEPDYPKLRERVRLADSVVVARVTTATERPSTSGPPTYLVELTPHGEPLAGAPPTGPVRLTLAPNSPSHRLFRWQRQRVLGKYVVLFFRRYAQDGEETIHFRAEPNIQPVHLAVQQAVLSL